MTGPLAQQFARLRDLSEEMSLALIELGDEDVHEKHGEICELSSVIERHVQDMEKALEELEDAATHFWGHLDGDYRDVPDTSSNLYVARFRAMESALAGARAALPAREKGADTR